MQIRDATLVRGYRQQNITIRGVEPSYGRIRNMTMSSGRWLSGEDDTTKQRVAVIGAKAAEKLFGEIPPDGDTSFVFATTSGEYQSFAVATANR